MKLKPLTLKLFEVTISTYAKEITTRVNAINKFTAIGKAVLLVNPPEILNITVNEIKG
jgi:hypothetical protein